MPNSQPDPQAGSPNPQAILQATILAAERLLVCADWRSVAETMLAAVGRASHADRAVLSEVCRDDDGVPRASLIGQWTADDHRLPVDADTLLRIPFADHAPVCTEALSRGQVIYGPAADLSEAERTALGMPDALTVVAVPVMAEGSWRVLLCLGRCREASEWTDGELDALRQLGRVLGAAVGPRETLPALKSDERDAGETLDQLPDMVCELDADLRVRYANRAASDALGCPPGTGLDALLNGAEPADVSARLADSAATGAVMSGVYTFQRADGTELPGEVHAVATRNAAGAHTGYVLVIRDIHQRPQVDEAGRQAAIGHLASGIAHEFNNILAIINGRAEFASLVRTEEEYKALVDTALASTRRAADITRKLMTFARRREPDLKPMRVETAVNEAAAMAEWAMREAGIDCAREYGAGDHFVLGDRMQLQEALLHLILNACQAMPDGGTLTLQTRHAPGNGRPGEVIVSVSDTGSGIDAENLPHIFEPFFTTRRVVGEKKVAGKGLGLSVTQGIILGHEGSITVASSPAEGTRFDVFLPEHEGPVDDDVLLEATADHDATSAPHRVLVAEEDHGLRDAILSAFATDGYDVVSAQHAYGALEALNTTRVDLVVTNLLLPGGAARQILDAALTLPSHPGVILIANEGEETMAGELLGRGARACFVKPVDLSSLVATGHAHVADRDTQPF